MAAEGGEEPGAGGGLGLALVEGSAGRAARVGDPGDLVALARQVQQVRAVPRRRDRGGGAGPRAARVPGVPLPLGRPQGLLSRRRPWCLPARPAALRCLRRPPAISRCPLPVCPSAPQYLPIFPRGPCCLCLQHPPLHVGASHCVLLVPPPSDSQNIYKVPNPYQYTLLPLVRPSVS